MSTSLRLLIEIALLAVAFFVVVFLRRGTAGAVARAAVAVISAFALAGIGYLLATRVGWTPVGRAGDSVEDSPQSFFTLQALCCLLGFLFIAFVRPKRD